MEDNGKGKDMEVGRQTETKEMRERRERDEGRNLLGHDGNERVESVLSSDEYKVRVAQQRGDCLEGRMKGKVARRMGRTGHSR